MTAHLTSTNQSSKFFYLSNFSLILFQPYLPSFVQSSTFLSFSHKVSVFFLSTFTRSESFSSMIFYLQRSFGFLPSILTGSGDFSSIDSDGLFPQFCSRLGGFLPSYKQLYLYVWRSSHLKKEGDCNVMIIRSTNHGLHVIQLRSLHTKL